MIKHGHFVLCHDFFLAAESTFVPEYTLLFNSYKFVKGFLAITFFYYLLFLAETFHGVCQRFLYSETKFEADRTKQEKFPHRPPLQGVKCPINSYIFLYLEGCPINSYIFLYLEGCPINSYISR